MERFATVHIERLPEGVYLATSDDIPGLIAQGRTIAQTFEIARDVARKLVELDQGAVSLADLGETFDFPLIVAA